MRPPTDHSRLHRVLSKGLSILLAVLMLGLGVPGSALALLSTSADGFYWQNPLPQGNTLMAASLVDTDTIVAVGGYGTIIHTESGGAAWSAGTSSYTGTNNNLDSGDGASMWIVGDAGTILRSTDGAATWTVQTSGTTEGLLGVASSGTDNGWAVGGGGTILHTSNGGATWAPQVSGTTQYLFDVCFVDANSGWAVGMNGTLLHTDDGGANWTAQVSGTTDALNSLSFTDAQNGWAGSSSGTILRTTDGGANWSVQTLPNGDGVTDISATSTDIAWVAAGVRAYTTSNGGSSWTEVALPPLGFNPSYLGVTTFGDGSILFVGTSGTMRRSSDGGATWVDLKTGWRGGFNAVDFPTGTDGWVVGDAGAIFHTSDGVTWAQQTVPRSDYLYGVSFASATTGWAVGENGLILATTDGGQNWQQQSRLVFGILEGVAGVDSSNAWAVGRSGRIARTANGVNWAAQTSGTTQDLKDVCFIDANEGWAVGVAGTILHTVNGGTTWTSQTSNATMPLLGVSFTDSQNGWAVGEFGTLRKTSDGGTTWTNVNIPGRFGNYVSVDFVTSTCGAILYNGGAATVVYYTNDAGSSWFTYQTGTQNLLGDAVMRSENTGWAVGSGGTILGMSIGPDADPPVTTHDAPTGWVSHDVTLTLTPYDARSGVANTYAWIDPSAPTTYTAPLLLSAEGTTTISFFSVDANANRENTKTAEVHIDKTPPASSCDATGSYAGFAVASLDTSDSVSGLLGRQYSLDGSAWAAYTGPITITRPGAHALQYYATDVAGNIEPTQTATFEVVADDTLAPVTTFLAPSGWQTDDTTVTLSAVDVAGSGETTSGLAATNYGINGAGAVEYTAPFVVTAEGTTTIAFSSTDWAGNAEIEQTRTVSIDRTPPTIAAVAAAQSGLDVSVSIMASDTLSGVTSVRYEVDGGGEQAYDGPFMVSGVGVYAVGYSATNGAGQTSTGTLDVTVIQPDDGAPVTSSNIPAGWVGSNVTVTLSALDTAGSATASSGVEWTRYSLSGAQVTAETTYAAPFTVSAEGQTSVRFFSSDHAGNIESANVELVRIDKTAPVTGANVKSLYFGPATVVLSPSDSLSGVGNTYYRLDGGAQQSGTSVAVPSYGFHTLVYWSVDGAGNIEGQHAVAFRVLSAGRTPIQGATRFETAVEASERAFPGGAATVLLATGRNWPDALGGSALAGAVDGPLLLVEKDSIPTAVLGEIDRLSADKVYILGGAGAVSVAVEQQLKSLLGAGNVERLSGANRYETAQKVADEVIALAGAEYDGSAFVSTGANFPDALGASPIANAKVWPILLAPPGGMPYLPAQTQRVVILGGAGAVASATETGLKAKLGGGNVQRVGGTSRYQTAALVADYGVAQGLGWDGLGLATGASFPDALAGGAMLGSLNAVMLLTPGTSLDTDARLRIVSHKTEVDTVHYMGGPAALSQTVRDQVETILQ